MEIKENVFKIIVKTNSPENKIISYDPIRKAYLIEINALAEDNKANIQIIKFLTRILGRRVRIKTGLRSKEKLIETYSP